MYPDQGHELPGVHVYLSGTQGAVEEGDRGRVCALWWVHASGHQMRYGVPER